MAPNTISSSLHSNLSFLWDLSQPPCLRLNPSLPLGVSFSLCYFIFLYGIFHLKTHYRVSTDFFVYVYYLPPSIRMKAPCEQGVLPVSFTAITPVPRNYLVHSWLQQIYVEWELQWGWYYDISTEEMRFQIWPQHLTPEFSWLGTMLLCLSKE